MIRKKTSFLLLSLVGVFLIFICFQTFILITKKQNSTKKVLAELITHNKRVLNLIQGDSYLYISKLFIDRREELIELYPTVENILDKEICGLNTFYLTKDGLCYGFYTHSKTYSVIFDTEYLSDYLASSGVLLCGRNNILGKYKQLCNESFLFDGLNFVIPVKNSDDNIVGTEVYSLVKVSFIEILYLILSLFLLYYVLSSKGQNLEKLNSGVKDDFECKDLETKYIALEKEYMKQKQKYIDLLNAQKLKENVPVSVDKSELNELKTKLNAIKDLVYTMLSNSVKPLETTSEGLKVVSPPKVKRYVKALGLLKNFYNDLSLFIRSVPDMEGEDIVILKEYLYSQIKKMMLNLHTLEETLSVIGLMPMVEELKKVDLLQKENTRLMRQIDTLRVESMELSRLKLSIEKILEIIEGEQNGKS